MFLAEIAITGWNVLGWGVAIFSTAMIFSKVFWKIIDRL
jgi:hypothetical protein